MSGINLKLIPVGVHLGCCYLLLLFTCCGLFILLYILVLLFVFCGCFFSSGFVLVYLLIKLFSTLI